MILHSSVSALAFGGSLPANILPDFIKDSILVPTEKGNKKNLNIFESIIEKALSLISKLIASSANARNGDGMTPLIFATNQNEIDAIKIIISLSDINAIDKYGESALFHSMRNKTPDIGLYLLNSRANLNYINKVDGSTPLMEAVSSRNLFLAKELVNRGASLETKDRYGFTAYERALNEGFKEDYQFLKPS